ncbi:MAG: hypothetical protein JWM37_408 [Candidatus Saccharibacteria bacterium]|nr:hypothetical protein [Candidatus Saccharibacteria bacterium]
MIGLIVCSFVLGDWRGSTYHHQLDRYDAYVGVKQTVSVTALSDAVYDLKKQLTFDAQDVTIGAEHLKGKIAVSGFGENMVFKGDRLFVTGSMRAARGSYKARISFAALQVQYHHDTLIDRWRRQFAAALTSTLPEPLAPFGMGLLIGQRNTLPKETSDTLLWVGLTHIIAVSGYNLTILLQASRRLLNKGSKYQTLLLSLGLIGTFLLFSGNSPSIVRAAIVSSLGLLAWYYGRQFNAVLLILLTAVITSWANPSYVWSDSGWYLSFLAFAGILILAPALKHYLPHRLAGSLIGGMVLESICAELMTLPYLLYVFGQTSVVALVANIAVASFVPLAMLCTMIAGLAGLWLPLWAGYFAWPANMILNYMLDACALLSRVPHVFVENFYISLAGMMLWYATVAVSCVILSKKNAIITDRNQLLT